MLNEINQNVFWKSVDFMNTFWYHLNFQKSRYRTLKNIRNRQSWNFSAILLQNSKCNHSYQSRISSFQEQSVSYNIYNKLLSWTSMFTVNTAFRGASHHQNGDFLGGTEYNCFAPLFFVKTSDGPIPWKLDGLDTGKGLSF